MRRAPVQLLVSEMAAGFIRTQERTCADRGDESI
jgi:hypothetical protein